HDRNDCLTDRRADQDTRSCRTSRRCRKVAVGGRCNSLIAVITAWGQHEPSPSPRRHGRSSSQTGQIRCGAERFSLVPNSDLYSLAAAAGAKNEGEMFILSALAVF